MKKTTKPTSDKKSAPVIRLVALKNPTTKRDVFARVTADGRLGKRDAEHLGVKKVAAWLEVVAKSWAEATKAAKAGKGKKVHAGQEKRGSAQMVKAA